MPKRALITGITGQDGSAPAAFLLDQGDEVHGSQRRASAFTTPAVDQRGVEPHGTTLPRAGED